MTAAAHSQHMRRLMRQYVDAQAEVDCYNEVEERSDSCGCERRTTCGCHHSSPSRQMSRMKKHYDEYDDEDDDDCDDDGGDSDDSLEDLNNQIAMLEGLAGQKAGTRQYQMPGGQQLYAPGGQYADGRQMVMVTGVPDPAQNCNTVDAVVIPEDVDVEYDKQGNAHIHKRQGNGGVTADVISLPHRGVGQRLPEEAIDAFVPLEGNHTFKIEAPGDCNPAQVQAGVQVLAQVHTHGQHLHQHFVPNPVGLPAMQPGGHVGPIGPIGHGSGPTPGPIIDKNGQLLVPTGRWKVEKVRVKKHRH